MIKYILTLLLFMSVIMSSCKDWDNYEEPSQTLKGEVIDKNTGEPVYTEVGGGGIRIKLLEKSWSENPTPYEFFAMQDGSFRNTKIFKGEYNIEPQGPFVPLVRKDSVGNVIKDESKTKQISGVTDVTFEVEPFLNIELVSDAEVADDTSSFSIEARVTRGTSNPDFQQELTDIYLFVNHSSKYVGNNNFNSALSPRLRATQANAALDSVITLTAPNFGGLDVKETYYYYRVAAKINQSVAGQQRYNYSKVDSVLVP